MGMHFTSSFSEASELTEGCPCIERMLLTCRTLLFCQPPWSTAADWWKPQRSNCSFDRHSPRVITWTKKKTLHCVCILSWGLVSSPPTSAVPHPASRLKTEVNLNENMKKRAVVSSLEVCFPNHPIPGDLCSHGSEVQTGLGGRTSPVILWGSPAFTCSIGSSWRQHPRNTAQGMRAFPWC